MMKILYLMHSVVWGAPALLLILGIGIWFTLGTGAAQLRLLPCAWKAFFRKRKSSVLDDAGVSPFQALCTALAATVGTGNLVGVAGGICLGGPGAVFWMWVCGIFGMITKCGEITLAMQYRCHKNGEFLGGPMYMIHRGLGPGKKWLANTYAILGIGAAFGVGNAVQINAVVGGINTLFPVALQTQLLRRNIALGLILAVLTGIVLLGGARKVGSAAELLVPFAAVGYILLCAVALVNNYRRIPSAFSAIFEGAFSPRGITGGVITSPFLALRTGCSRGVFTNEAGMGTASIAHASAQASHPVEQGLMGMIEVFLDTIVLCTLTALVILTSSIPIPYGMDPGGVLTDTAFCSTLGAWASVFLTSALCCFAFATVLGWGLYGARCAQFLLGSRGYHIFALLQTMAVLPGAVMHTGSVWLLAEVVNGLMVIPNVYILAVLAPEFFRLMKEYRIISGSRSAGGGNYADFHQCKPL